MPRIEFIITKPNSKIRVICFHYAGGSPAAFYSWVNNFPNNLELAALQLPGRATRFTEPLLSNMDLVINHVFNEFKKHLDKPYILFGHSVGALIAYELTRKLQNESLPVAKHLIASGSRAPHIPFRRKQISHLSHAAFKNELLNYNGTPPEVLENEELQNLFFPILRADFSISETYHYYPGKPIPCDITALSGNKDSLVSEDDIQAWQQHTSASFRHISLPGDHFFIKPCQNTIIDIIQTISDEALF